MERAARPDPARTVKRRVRTSRRSARRSRPRRHPPFWPEALNENPLPENVLAHDFSNAQLHIGNLELEAQHVYAAKAHRWSATADPAAGTRFGRRVFYNSGATGGARAIEAGRVPERAQRRGEGSPHRAGSGAAERHAGRRVTDDDRKRVRSTGGFSMSRL